jgi:hypothetical protein
MGAAAVGKRSGMPETQAQVAKMTLAQLNAEIARCLRGFEQGGTSQGRKAFFDRLVWYERMREEIHGIPAPARRARRR